MNNKKTLLLGALALALLLGGATVLYDKLSGQVETPQLAADGSTSSAEEPKGEEDREVELAPDFTVYDGEGEAVNLSDFRGKPVVVNFWASWCKPCRSEMPAFQTAYETYGEEVHFLMVNMTDGSQETQESASAYVEDSGYTFPVYYDTKSSAAIAYGVYSLPTTYFIDGDGAGVAYANMPLSDELLEQGISMILG